MFPPATGSKSPLLFTSMATLMWYIDFNIARWQIIYLFCGLLNCLRNILVFSLFFCRLFAVFVYIFFDFYFLFFFCYFKAFQSVFHQQQTQKSVSARQRQKQREREKEKHKHLNVFAKCKNLMTFLSRMFFILAYLANCMSFCLSIINVYVQD